MLEIPSFKDASSGLVDQAKQEMRNFQKQIKDYENDVKNLPDQINNFITQLAPVSLSECEAANQAATRKILDSIKSLKSSILIIRDEVQKISAAMLRLLSLNPDVIDGKVDEISAKFTDLIEKPVRQGVDTVFDELSTDLIPCRGVYNAYQNLGSLVCEDVGAPYHGVWAATGLCGLWFLITAIILLLINRRNTTTSKVS
ncbi:hypothetical protein ANCCAN_06575 [Ancylostoma caninum]|uniref:Uncharacterized protein n=1 Tax=Ancylostoma caninum TaxID=29170 RepID=A0A368GWC8_ANCCA|nr:hypothetical protein ANCCAN_06575 [Ancylostoma caninum]